MNPIEICRRNAEAEKAKRAELREQFPFTVGIVAELKTVGFKPRVLWMQEDGREWRRK